MHLVFRFSVPYSMCKVRIVSLAYFEEVLGYLISEEHKEERLDDSWTPNVLHIPPPL